MWICVQLNCHINSLLTFDRPRGIMHIALFMWMVKRWYKWLAPNSGPGELTLLPWLRRHKALLSSEAWKKLTYLHRCLWTFSPGPLRAFWQTVSQYGKATAQSLKRRLSSEWRKLLNISSLSYQLQKSTIDAACGGSAASSKALIPVKDCLPPSLQGSTTEACTFAPASLGIASFRQMSPFCTLKPSSTFIMYYLPSLTTNCCP